MKQDKIDLAEVPVIAEEKKRKPTREQKRSQFPLKSKQKIKGLVKKKKKRIDGV